MDLIATKRMKYATRMLEAGDPFTAKSRREGVLFIAAKRAELAPEPQVDEITEARAEYTEIVGKKPYMGWDVAKLREKIADATAPSDD